MNISKRRRAVATLSCAVPLVLSIFLCNSPPSYASNQWNQGPFEIDKLSRLQNRGLGNLQIRFVTTSDDSSFSSIAYIESLKNSKVVFSRQLPLDSEVNLAKCWAEASSSNTITIYSQSPGSASTLAQTFSINGDHVAFVSSSLENETTDFCDKIVALAAAGDVPQLKRSWEDAECLLYPQTWVNSSNLEKAVLKGHAQALSLARRGRPDEAAERLKLMFDTVAELYSLCYVNVVDVQADSEMESWMAIWNSDEAPVRKSIFLPALNDYGYFLQLSGRHKEAIAVFEEVLQCDPTRVVAHLNLADSEWCLGRKLEAGSSYYDYNELMKQSRRDSRIPDRVNKRLAEVNKSRV